MKILLRFPTLKSSPQFTVMIHLGRFFSNAITRRNNRTFQSKIFALDKNEPMYAARK